MDYGKRKLGQGFAVWYSIFEGFERLMEQGIQGQLSHSKIQNLKPLFR